MSAASKAREAGIARFVTCLRDYGDGELAGKLATCQAARLAHRQAVKAGVWAPWPARCRSPACEACRSALTCSWYDRTWRRWRDLDANADEVSSVTVLLARCGTMAEVFDVLAQVRQRFANKRAERRLSCRQREARTKRDRALQRKPSGP